MLTGYRKHAAEERLLQARWIDPETGCWNFRGAVNSKGHAVIRFDGKLYLARRLAAAVWLGLDLASQHQVRTTCRNRRCINPDHIAIPPTPLPAASRQARTDLDVPSLLRQFGITLAS